MATTTNYGWTTPDDTALVKDGAAAIRTLGSSVDTTTKNLNPETTLGDIAYRSSTANVKTRLALGTAGQVLQVNSGATAPEWATPAGGGANWSLLNAGGTALTGAQTITVSGISGKDKIMVFFQNASSASASSYTQLQLNTDTGSNYGYFGSEYGLKTTWNAAAFSTLSSTTATGIFLAGANTDANSMTGYAIISGANASGVKIIQGSGIGNGGGDNNGYNVGGFYSGSSVISSISIKSLVGNWDGGTVYVYTSA
jgi:hypothetical protein